MSKHRYKYIKRADGRTQKAMVLASGKLKFVKNDKKSAPSRARKATKHVAKKSSKAITHRRRSAPKTHRRARRHGAGLSPMTLAITGLGVGYLAGAQGPAMVKNLTDKIPGSKTFGPVATLGLAAFAINKWVKPNKYLKYAGYIGIAAAAMKIGDSGSNFKWVGESHDVADISDIEDLEDLEDLEDVEDVEDVEGDDD